MLNNQLESTRNSSFWYCAILFVALLGFVGMFVQPTQNNQLEMKPSNDLPFSTARAITFLENIAAKPHHPGSLEHEKVRQYLLTQLTDFGLEAHIQSGLSYRSEGGIDTMAQVYNVVGKLPGSKTGGKALLLMAHYDSVPTGPGASDNGASVAAILEAVKSTMALGQFENDIIVLFSDAEEVGLLGANYFVHHHPWAQDVGLVLNFEYRGNSGPVLMFETSEGYSKLIAHYKAAVKPPSTNSFLYEVYNLLPNDTDMTIFKEVGLKGLNFASIEQAHHYHNEIDTVANMDRATLELQGKTIASLLLEFGNQDLAELEGENTIFFNVPSLGLVEYSNTLSQVFAVMFTLLLIAMITLAMRQKLVVMHQIVKAALAMFGAILLIAICSQLLWEVIVMLNPVYYLIGHLHNGHWYLLAFSFLSLASFVYLKSKWLSGYSTLTCAFGASSLWLVFFIMSMAWIPGTAFIFTWPLLGLLIFAAYLLLVKPKGISWHLAIITLVSVIPLVMIFTPIIELIYISVGPQAPIVTVIFIVLAATAAVSWISQTQHKWVNPIVPFAIGFLFIVGGLSTQEYDENNPIPTNLFYVYNGTADEAYWISRLDEHDSWTKPVFSEQKAPVVTEEVFGPDSPPYWTQPIDKIPGIDSPQIELVKQQRVDQDRLFTFKIRSKQNSENLAIRIDHAQVLGATINNVELTSDHDGYWRLNAYGIGNSWVDVQLKIAGDDPFTLRVYDEVFQLPPNNQLASRSKTLSPSIVGSSHSTRTVITKEYQ